MNRLNRSILAIAVAGCVSVGFLRAARGGQPVSSGAVALAEHVNKHLYNAMIHLRTAQQELKEAEPIYTGHRKAAMDETEAALKLVEEAWKATGEKESSFAPSAANLDEAPVLNHMHKGLAELHDAYKEIDEVESIFQKERRIEAVEHIEKAIRACHEGLNEAGK